MASEYYSDSAEFDQENQIERGHKNSSSALKPKINK